MIPTRKPKAVKIALTLNGRGGVARADVAGLTAATPVNLKLGKLPDGVTITGIESEKGKVAVSWVAASAQSNAQVSAEVTE